MMKKSASTAILIIDDDPVARMLSKRNLEIAGFLGDILSAEDGEVGFQIMMEMPNITFTIILDYHMPLLDGLGFLKRMENENLKNPVFMLSSSIMKSHKEECLAKSNVLNYFVKPIDQPISKTIIEACDTFITT